jgi:hypothetical protein
MTDKLMEYTGNGTYVKGIDPEVTCWHCGKTFLCDAMDATCRLCHAPFAKERCNEFGFIPTMKEGKINMEQVYCVVKEKAPGNCTSQYGFSKWHESKESAIVEARRLAESENRRFYVLQVIGFADRKPNPVEFTEVQRV